MGKLSTIFKDTKVNGIPVLWSDSWRIEWELDDGSKRMTPFGFKEKYQAENHIVFVLEEQKKLSVLR